MKYKLKKIRRLLIFFMAALFISGATAIPLEAELRILCRLFPDGDAGYWFNMVREGLMNHSIYYPFLDYGYDWLAFAHFMLVILFIGPYRDPVRNKWVIDFGMVACMLIIPFALLAGHFRGIPLTWRLIDCSFGLAGIIPLWYIKRLILRIESVPKPAERSRGRLTTFRVVTPASLIKQEIEFLN